LDRDLPVRNCDLKLFRKNCDEDETMLILPQMSSGNDMSWHDDGIEWMEDQVPQPQGRCEDFTIGFSDATKCGPSETDRAVSLVSSSVAGMDEG
jgi:hypothetical protein